MSFEEFGTEFERIRSGIEAARERDREQITASQFNIIRLLGAERRCGGLCMYAIV